MREELKEVKQKVNEKKRERDKVKRDIGLLRGTVLKRKKIKEQLPREI